MTMRNIETTLRALLCSADRPALEALASQLAPHDWAALLPRLDPAEVELLLRVGLREHERAAPQPVLVDLELYRADPGRPQGLADCLDYDRLWRHLSEALPARPVRYQRA